MIWVAGRSPTLVSHSLRGVATNLKATTLAYLAIVVQLWGNFFASSWVFRPKQGAGYWAVAGKSVKVTLAASG
jgi:hypothetical protein